MAGGQITKVSYRSPRRRPNPARTVRITEAALGGIFSMLGYEAAQRVFGGCVSVIEMVLRHH